MVTMKASGVLMGICLMFSIQSSAAQSAAESFGAHGWPSAPRLALNEEPKLCGELLGSATEAFLSDLGDVDPGEVITTNYPRVEMEPVESKEGKSGAGFIGRADLDIDGDGSRQVVIYRDIPFNWSGDWHYAYVFPSVDSFAKVKDAAFSAWGKLDDDQYPSPTQQHLGAQQYFPGALTNEGKAVSTGNVWASHSLFSFEGRYYFAFARNDFDRLMRPSETTIYRLRASGRVEPKCVIDSAADERAAMAFASLPAMGSFLSLIRTIGEPGPDSGTLHAETWHNAQAEAAVNRAVSRPWTVAANVMVGYQQGEYFVFGPRMTRFLEEWSQMELWNRREYQTLLASLGPATESYAGFLRSEFGVTEPAATQGARKVIENLLARRILIPAQYLEDGLEYFPQSTLHRGLMLRDHDQFEAGVAEIKYRAATDGAPTLDTNAQYSRALLDAVEWSYGLDRLLELGADPNTANEFGKTPLMVAAHFDRVDSVRKLLRAGAKVDLQTTEGDRFTLQLGRTRRTALMYAAENASPPVIKALLDAGADKSSKDSQGNGMSFYLDNNPRFTSEQRSRGVEGIAAEAGAFARASFDCARARTNAELAICTSPVLRTFDIQIESAYRLLKQKPGSRLAAEQRAWLKYRDDACKPNSDADCLAEVMRTRLRYLHMRQVE